MTQNSWRSRNRQRWWLGATVAAAALGLVVLLGAVNAAFANYLSLDVTGPRDAARSIQAHFQAQMQSWTHILLRAEDGEQRVGFGSQFTEEQATVRAGAERLRRELDADPKAQELLTAFLAAHDALSERYANAWSAFEQSHRTDPAAADRLVGRGDREAAALLDRLTVLLAARASGSHDEFAAAIARIEWIGASVLLLLLVALASLTLRHGVGAAAASGRRIEPRRTFTEVGA